MDLKSLLVSTKEMEVEFPNCPGFMVKLCYLDKESMRKIGEKSKIMGFDRKTRQPTEEMDEELFTKLYIGKALVGWKGLKLSYLKDLVLLDIEGEEDEEALMAFTPENAIDLVTASKDFDAWISSVISDVSLFNKRS